MKIIGIDGSTKKTGVALYEDGKYITHTLLDCHKIADVFVRIPTMADAICKYIDQFDQIDKIIMEKSVQKNNVDTVQKLSNIAGAIMLYAFQRGIEFSHPVPTEWRKKTGLQQSNKIKREILKEEAIKAVEQEYGMIVTDDEAESMLLARSGFDLPKITVQLEDI